MVECILKNRVPYEQDFDAMCHWCEKLNLEEYQIHADTIIGKTIIRVKWN